MGTKIDTQILLEGLQKIYTNTGYITDKSINDYGLFSASVVRNRFGSLSNAMVEAG